MSAEITVQADSLLTTLKWCIGFAFSAWATSLLSAWYEVQKSRKETLSLRDRLSIVESKLAVISESSSKIIEIKNNLRQIQSAAHQSILEDGKDSVPINSLIGPRKYIREIRPALGESYGPDLITLIDGPTATLPSGVVIKLK